MSDWIARYFEHFGLTFGTLIILGIGIIIFLIVAFIAERRTRVIFPDRKKKEGDDGGFLDFSDDDD